MPGPLFRLFAPASLAVILLVWGDWGLVAPVSGRAGETGPARQAVVDDAIGSLATGRLLVAARQVSDPTFEQSVILLFARSEEGTAGLILNRPTTVPAARVLPDMPGGAGGPRTFFGGPVSIGEIRGLLRTAVGPTDATPLLPGLHLLATPERAAGAIAGGATVEQLRLYYGYAGWGPGQLEREIRRGDWYVLAGDVSVIFDPDPGTIWFRRIRLTETIAA